MAKILNIEEVSDYLVPRKVSWSNNLVEEYYDGYLIETEEKKIYLLIDVGQQCCEHFGYFISEDDYKSFVGQEFIEVVVVDEELNASKINLENFVSESDYDPEDYSAMFINIVTDKDVLQLAVYNANNGYYGHNVLIIVNDEKESFTV